MDSGLCQWYVTDFARNWTPLTNYTFCANNIYAAYTSHSLHYNFLLNKLKKYKKCARLEERLKPQDRLISNLTFTDPQEYDMHIAIITKNKK